MDRRRVLQLAAQFGAGLGFLQLLGSGDSAGTAAGIPMTIALKVVSASSCAPFANQAICLWHCDRVGLYSLYPPA